MVGARRTNSRALMMTCVGGPSSITLVVSRMPQFSVCFQIPRMRIVCPWKYFAHRSGSSIRQGIPAMLSLSLKNELDNTAYPPVFIPNPPTLTNFVDVFQKNDFLKYTINSVIVSFSATGLALLFGVPAGYGIAKAKATKASCAPRTVPRRSRA